MTFRRAAFILMTLVTLQSAPVSLHAIQEMEAGPAKSANSKGKSLDDYKRVALAAQRAAEADPSEANLFAYAASLLPLDLHSAEVIYRFAVNKYPGSVRLHLGLASALEGQPDRQDEAAAELCGAADLAPADPHPLEFLVATKQIPQAFSEKVVAGLHRLHERYPHDGLILFDYEMALSNRYTEPNSKLPADFEPVLKEAIRLDPRLPEAYSQLGLVYEERKDYAQEVQALLQAVRLSPKDSHFRYRLAMAYKQLGDHDLYLKEISIFQQMRSSSSTVRP